MPSDRRRPHEPGPSNHHAHLVVVANGARARLLALPATDPVLGDPPALAEIGELIDPSARQRDVERFSESRPGLRREGPQGPRHAVSDRRESHRREDTRRFAGRVADRVVRAWRSRPGASLVLVAAPVMLGTLRDALAVRLTSEERAHVRTHDHDLVRLSAVRVHEALAAAGLLPARGRKPPLRPPQSPGPWPPTS